eukprot:TRINITY_DN143_c0_g1_i2.p1 TRINITY_DN143_c0_g1~~TRINITY_DN143_c0_g1_i2.p1  ORF type:complete len:580 (-),score=197.12 TRINITY_DN143_c0_g1_i2:154-1893(-)
MPRGPKSKKIHAKVQTIFREVNTPDQLEPVETKIDDTTQEFSEALRLGIKKHATVDIGQALKSVRALKSFLANKPPKPYDLDKFQLMNIIIKTTQPIPPRFKTSFFVQMPHPLFPSDSGACLIVMNSPVKIHESFEKSKVQLVKKICTLQDLRSIHKDKEALHKFAKDYEMFFVQDNAVSKAAKILGNRFGPTTYRTPFPINPSKPGGVDKSISMARDGCYVRIKDSNVVIVKIARTDQSDKDCVENITQTINAIVSKIPKKWAGVKSVSLKGGPSVELPIFGDFSSGTTSDTNTNNNESNAKEEEEEVDVAEEEVEEAEEEEEEAPKTTKTKGNKKVAKSSTKTEAKAAPKGKNAAATTKNGKQTKANTKPAKPVTGDDEMDVDDKKPTPTKAQKQTKALAKPTTPNKGEVAAKSAPTQAKATKTTPTKATTTKATPTKATPTKATTPTKSTPTKATTPTQNNAKTTPNKVATSTTPNKQQTTSPMNKMSPKGAQNRRSPNNRMSPNGAQNRRSPNNRMSPNGAQNRRSPNNRMSPNGSQNRRSPYNKMSPKGVLRQISPRSRRISKQKPTSKMHYLM